MGTNGSQKSATQSNCTKFKLTAQKSATQSNCTKNGHKKLTAQKSATQSNCTKFKLTAQLLVEQASRLLIIKRLSDLNN
jgi:hypothetical protein